LKRFLLLAPLVLTACGPVQVETTAPQPTQVDYFEQLVEWEDCGDYQCAEIFAPLDWDFPEFDSITISLLKLDNPTTEETVFLNPGGPGVSANQWMRDSGAGIATETVIQNFDLVTFDPRGVGESTAVSCPDDELKDELLYGQAESTEQSKELIAQYIEHCQQSSGAILEYVGTRNAAKDLDLIRALLGLEKLNFIGYSYGTELASTYLALFPDRVGRFVLDGAVDPTIDSRQATINQLKGFDSAFENYLLDCIANECPMGEDLENAKATVSSLFDQVIDNPIAVGSRELTSSGLVTGIIAALYQQAAWPVLTDAFADLLQGNGNRMLFLADVYNERESDGSYRGNLIDANIAINCADDRLSSDPDDVRELNEQLLGLSEVFGESWQDGHLMCESWPGAPPEDNLNFSVSTEASPLVIGTTGDPATPYSQAQSLSELLDGAVLLTFEGEGHTIFGQGVGCIDDQVDEYLIGGTIPQKLVC
jgi:pimeloyl-ACP methyl ester carboxylesterase